MQWVFDKRLAFGEDGVAPLARLERRRRARRALGRDELVALAAREIEDALPGARGARLVRATVIRERQATFSLAPGQPSRPATRTAVDGLVLAGDWIDTGLPGTIESAVVSGDMAAREVLIADMPIADLIL